MKDYITESINVLESFGETIIACAITPAKKGLFNKDEAENSKFLSNDKAAAFYYVVSKLLYVSK